VPRASVARSAATLLEGALVAIIAFTVLLGVVRPLIGPAVLGIGTGAVFGTQPTVQAKLDLTAVQIRTIPDLPTAAGRGELAAGDAFELTLPDATTVVVSDPNAQQLLGLVGSEVLAALLAVAVLAMLLAVVRTLRRGDPFVPANARRLYTIAGTVGLGGVAVELLRAWGEFTVLSHPSIEPYVIESAEFSFVPVVAGLGIAVAAEVFRQGAALREEVEGLV
jgi:hypothetical protein